MNVDEKTTLPQTDPEAHESFDLVFLDPKTIRFEYEGNNLTLTDSDGRHYPLVTLRRCYPLSASETFILVRLPDDEDQPGRELGILKDCRELQPESYQAVRQELRLHYLVPVIQRVHHIREEFGFLYWSVDTDRGAKEFIMRDSIISSTRRMSPTHWLLIDINQTRYEIRDLEALDHRSQEMVKKYLLL